LLSHELVDVLKDLFPSGVQRKNRRQSRERCIFNGVVCTSIYSHKSDCCRPFKELKDQDFFLYAEFALKRLSHAGNFMDKN
uniref:hypothetical protein n=1 Tax=Vibrio vulnificus TaxID=672 RepID=UPI0019D415D1